MTISPSLRKELEAFENLIENAPDAPSLPTAEEQAELDRIAVIETLTARQRQALAKSTGWPAKALTDVQTIPLKGDKWLERFEKAKAVIANDGILILFGGRGPGKSRMAAELAVIQGQADYITAMGFFLDVRATYNRNSDVTERDIINELTASRLLVLDEMQVRGDKPFEDRLLTHLVDARYAAQRPTILIANLTRPELSESLGASIVDRVRENGMVIEFNWPSFRA